MDNDLAIKDLAPTTEPANIPQEENNEPLLVPDGKFEAPNDSNIYYTKIQIGDTTTILPTIEQLSEGNCAEYSALNVALMALYFDFPIGDELQTFLDKHSMQEAKDILEAGYVLHLLNYFHSLQTPCGLKLQPEDRSNLIEKRQDIYASLTGTNSSLIFWSMLNGIESKCTSDNLRTSYSPELESRITSTNDLAIYFCDVANVHATGIFKYQGHYFSVDSMRRNNVIQLETEGAMVLKIKNLLQNRNGYILLSDLKKNESSK